MQAPFWSEEVGRDGETTSDSTARKKMRCPNVTTLTFRTIGRKYETDGMDLLSRISRTRVAP